LKRRDLLFGDDFYSLHTLIVLYVDTSIRLKMLQKITL
jgi:hypothetical protein